MQILKEAGVITKRSKQGFVKDGATFLVKVDISDVCLDKNKTRVIRGMVELSPVIKLKFYLGLLIWELGTKNSWHLVMSVGMIHTVDMQVV